MGVWMTVVREVLVGKYLAAFAMKKDGTTHPLTVALTDAHHHHAPPNHMFL